MKITKLLLEPNRINQSYFAEDEVDEIGLPSRSSNQTPSIE
jgi:hypothetical protein